MNNVYLRSKENIKNIIIKYYVALIPLIIYGEYKNGLKPYLNNLVGFKGLIKPIIFDITGFIIGILVNIIYIKLIKKEKKTGTVFANLNPLYGLLIASVISINTKFIIFFSITFIILFINNFIKKININIVALTSIIIILITKIVSNLGYLNIYERTHELSLNSLDYLIGRGSGGINATCILLIITSYIMLFRILSYKKDIVVYTASIFFILILGYTIYINNITSIFNTIFSNNVLFCYVFIASEPTSSSYTKKGKIIYSIMIAIITLVLYIIYPEIAALSAILISSVFNKIIDKLCEK